jgi:hypothetical protein
VNHLIYKMFNLHVEPFIEPDLDTIVGSWGDLKDCLYWTKSNHTNEFDNLKILNLWLLSLNMLFNLNFFYLIWDFNSHLIYLNIRPSSLRLPVSVIYHYSIIAPPSNQTRLWTTTHLWYHIFTLNLEMLSLWILFIYKIL